MNWGVEALQSVNAQVTESTSGHVYDCIGVGFGPSNIALAVALEEIGLIDNVLFLEAACEPSWQPGMLMPGTDIQHHPLRDFVTPRNPRSPYGFLTYLKDQGRLFEFLNLEAPFPPRSEYAGYVEWVARQFERVVRFGAKVEAIEAVDDPDHGPLARVRCGDGRTYLARTLSFAPGRSPLIPAPFDRHLGPRVVHLNDYQPSIQRWLARGEVSRIAVIGGSQSAVEIVLDIAARAPDVEIAVIYRRFGLKLKDVSPFTERIYMPEFVDYFYDAGEHGQGEIFDELRRSNYGASDHDVLAALNFRLYEQKVRGEETIRLRFNAKVEKMVERSDGGFDLELSDRYVHTRVNESVDAVIIATGFRNFGGDPEAEPYHPLLANLAPYARIRADGGLAVTRDFRLDYAGNAPPLPSVFLNGVCESSHGFGDAGSFSLLSVRSEQIARQIAADCRSPGSEAHALAFGSGCGRR